MPNTMYRAMHVMSAAHAARMLPSLIAPVRHHVDATSGGLAASWGSLGTIGAVAAADEASLVGTASAVSSSDWLALVMSTRLATQPCMACCCPTLPFLTLGVDFSFTFRMVPQEPLIFVG